MSITIFYNPRRHATTDWGFGPPEEATPREVLAYYTHLLDDADKMLGTYHAYFGGDIMDISISGSEDEDFERYMRFLHHVSTWDTANTPLLKKFEETGAT